MRILYVEDDRINGLLFAEACRLFPAVELEIAADGAEAIEIASTWAPHALMIDLHLPDTDGMKLLRALRALPSCESLPAILCTADDFDTVRTQALECGFVDCWVKPIDLRARIDDLLTLTGNTR